MSCQTEESSFFGEAKDSFSSSTVLANPFRESSVFSGIGLRVEIDRGPFRDSTGRTSQRRQGSNSSGLRDWFCCSDCFE